MQGCMQDASFEWFNASLGCKLSNINMNFCQFPRPQKFVGSSLVAGHSSMNNAESSGLNQRIKAGVDQYSDRPHDG